MERISAKEQAKAVKKSASPASRERQAIRGNRDSLGVAAPQWQSLSDEGGLPCGPTTLGGAPISSAGPVQAKKKKDAAPVSAPVAPKALKEQISLGKGTRDQIAGDEEHQLSFLDNLEGNFANAQKQGDEQAYDFLLDAASLSSRETEVNSLGLSSRLGAEGTLGLLENNTMSNSMGFAQHAVQKAKTAMAQYGKQVSEIARLNAKGEAAEGTRLSMELRKDPAFKDALRSIQGCWGLLGTADNRDAAQGTMLNANLQKKPRMKAFMGNMYMIGRDNSLGVRREGKKAKLGEEEYESTAVSVKEDYNDLIDRLYGTPTAPEPMEDPMLDVPAQKAPAKRRGLFRR